VERRALAIESIARHFAFFVFLETGVGNGATLVLRVDLVMADRNLILRPNLPEKRKRRKITISKNSNLCESLTESHKHSIKTIMTFLVN